VRKGSFLQVLGRVQNTRWTDTDGIERFGIEVVAERIDLLDRAGTGPADEDTDPADMNTGMQAADPAGADMSALDDEIPF
jgi:single-strand DNA-binding protein